jgi:spoIIIJ-associated protein
MDNRTTLEVIAPSIEEAIEKGLGELGVGEDDVDIEVLDSGSRGLFGLGSRQARIRITIHGENIGEQRPAPPAKIVLPAEKGQGAPQPAAAVEATPSSLPPDAIAALEEEERVADLARQTVADLLYRMHVHADVVAYFGPKDDPRSRAPLCVDINGKDLSILIGRHAETLNALQYITGLILGKELGYSIPLILDVENYRKRREQQLRQLARRMADQAIKTGRRQMLEPMPANERRIIHIELRANAQVETESVGEEPRRKVTILPK